MRPTARLMLMLGGIAVLFLNQTLLLAGAALLIASGYILLGRARSLVTFLLATSPFAVSSALLWVGVNIDTGTWNWLASLNRLFESGSPYLTFLRTLTASSAFFLAFATIEDGQLFHALRSMGLPPSGSLVFSSGFAVIGSVRSAFLRSHTALRAQGFIAPNAVSNLRHLPRVLGMTWVAGLDEALRRSNVMWDKNALLAGLQANPSGSQRTSNWSSAIGSGLGMILTILAIIGANNVHVTL